MMLNLEDPSLETMEEDVDQLKRTLLRIRAVLADAEGMERRDVTLNHWLQELKGVAFEADDVLDDYHLKSSDPTPSEEVCDSIHSTIRDGVASKIKGIRLRIDGIARQCEALNLREGDGEGGLDAQLNHLPTVSRVDEVVVYGREVDRKRVVELLVSDRRSELSVIPIVGTGGVGKTTLARLAYNDPMVCEHFDARGWVFVSEVFNMVRLMNAIAASLFEMFFSYTELGHLHTMIKQELEGRRFLLVLDDVWNEDQSLWDSLRAFLTVGLQGSVVLVTTRDESVARIMQTVPFYRLDCLSEDDCWSLFQQCVFGSSRDPSGHQNLVPIGKGIIKKFRGLPLAAKMVGCLLSSETIEESWHNILNSDLWDSNEIVGAITLGYYNLPDHLRRCFAYCAVFPKGYLFKKDHLVRLWMAEGFIQSMEGKREEDVGIEYFDELLRSSFFQYSQINQETFVMHDLIHNLIESISRKEICRVGDGNLCSVDSDTRHLSLIPQDFEAEVRVHSTYEHMALRTFLVIHRLLNTCDVTYISCKDRLHLQIPNDLFISLECLRTLDLSESDIVELPDSIGNLKHLRYLGLNHTKIRSLPESLCSLHNLQTLELRYCEDLRELPSGTKNLINLRHLYLPKFGTVVPVPPGIGLLTNLQILSPFTVRRGREHCAITELKDLMNLRGELDISGIESVARGDYAKGVLKDKEYITKLILRCGSIYGSEDLGSYDYSKFDGEDECFVLSQFLNDEYSIDHESQACESSLVDDGIEQKATKEEIVLLPNMSFRKMKNIVYLRKNKYKVVEWLGVGILLYLQPHTNLTELVIQNYQGVRFPSWMGDPSFSKLVSVTLDSCLYCEVLPPLGQLPSLKHLVIEELSELKSIGHEFYDQYAVEVVNGFPSLETLHFRSLYKLEEWDGAGCGGFPRLHQLDLSFCPKLRRMPHLLPSLKKLVMGVMGLCDEPIDLPTLPSLTSLELKGNCNQNIWSSVPHELLERLQSLKISGFEDLMPLPLHKLFALTELEISCCQKSMNSSFGQQLSYLASLKRLKMYTCPGIWFTQDQQLPSTLQFLDISFCSLLTEWCQRHGSRKLVHIRRVILDRKDFHPDDKGDTHQTDQERSRTSPQDALDRRVEHLAKSEQNQKRAE